MTSIAGKTAFITGGASGLGLATARALAAKGASVVLADIDADRVATAAEALSRAGARAMGLQLDVTDEASWAEAGHKARAFGPVRILFSNAGVGGGSGPFEQYDTDVWRWNYAVNAHAHLYACRTFLGEMKASGEASHLVITASMVAIVPPPISVAYISSKYATLGIAMALRNELADSCVGTSVLMPGMAATRIVETTRDLRPAVGEVGKAAATSQAMQGVLAGGMPPDRIGERVVRAVEAGEFWIFTHPEWKAMAELVTRDMLSAFGESADPAYKGDDIDGLIAANGGRMFGAGKPGENDG
ncbi:SDR family NAD(P)-dependent oxidoreductase [Novosphingobium sp. NBM11]|uniref:SDR family NAD(P)-dependent oxidoreductase n=1 Tax=Novosphingobium sp. NBM11 TaxID=2596914 RepID=UPI0018925CD3|nr:SDR family NAD(P)-dependent oxidoreductase [Novosphingobium sp. NBM11]MBF5091001.1 SDR family NAD(P)-dependent oxidoreductase [Novosphingobium sp. NBM11]